MASRSITSGWGMGSRWFNWYTAVYPLRVKLMKGQAPSVASIDTPTCVRRGENEPFIKVEYADKLGDYFSSLDFLSVPDAGHFVHYQKPEFAEQKIKAFFASIASFALIDRSPFVCTGCCS